MLLLLLSISIYGQTSSILDQLRVGFGAGANASHIIDLEPYTIFEDLGGSSYLNEYSPLFRNIGNQYFIQFEWYNDYLVVAMKPGTYTYSFSKLNEIAFSTETVELESPYLLRYIRIPAEVRYNYDLQRFRPYVGLQAAYSHLLGSLDASSRTFIRPRLSAGVSLGTYIDLRTIILDIGASYISGLHNIASRSERFSTGNGISFAQDDMLLNGIQFNVSILFSLQKQRRFSNVECYY